MVSPKRRPHKDSPYVHMRERTLFAYVRSQREETSRKRRGNSARIGRIGGFRFDERTNVYDSIVQRVESRRGGREKSRACENSLLAQGFGTSSEQQRAETKDKKILVVGVHGISLFADRNAMDSSRRNIEAEQNVRMSGVYRFCLATSRVYIRGVSEV